MIVTKDWLLTETPASRGQAAWGRRYRLWLQFRRNPLAMAGLLVVLALIVVALLAPWLATHDPGLQDLSRQITATAQASFQDNVSLLRSLTAIRTLQDAVALQTSTARTATTSSCCATAAT